MYYSPASSKDVPVAFATHIIEIYGYNKKKNKDLQYEGNKLLWDVFETLGKWNGKKPRILISRRNIQPGIGK